MKILGFMSGTSLDAVDMAVLETDGDAIQGFGPAGERKLSAETRARILEATEAAKTWARGEEPPASFEPAAAAVAEEHLAAADAFLEAHGIARQSLDFVGFHGQTVLHERPQAGRVGRTVQLGDARRLAAGLRTPVIYDFRSADVAAGGEGAPLAPAYHRARLAASGVAAPAAVLNLGGVANITVVGADGSLFAFDTGPANGMIDLLVQERTEGRFDEGGRLASAGRVDRKALEALLDNPYFAAPPPKSLDRYAFSMAPVASLGLEDAAATLTAFAAEAVARGVDLCGSKIARLILCGGGRRNPALTQAIGARAGVEVVDADLLGWRGDAVEAEAFAFLAARHVKGLPISFPGTTGAPRPLTGGRRVDP